MLNLISIIPGSFLGMLILLGILVVSLISLGKGADILVDEAVILANQWKIPKMIIGATIVSLGTTLPEVTVSVMSAVRGFPALAMGNAVGSIICDTGLILGIAAIISPLPFDRKVINRQSWIQVSMVILLVIISFVFGHFFESFKNGGLVPQFMGFVFLAILAFYMFSTVKFSKKNTASFEEDLDVDASSPVFLVILKLIFGTIIIIISSEILIPVVQEIALRLGIPETIIAATLVAFGTSLPELVTAIAASRKGHGDLAIGNVLGADILNVLFVVGAAAAVTPGGLQVDIHFFKLLFPVMVFLVLVCKIAISLSKDHLKKGVGFVLLFSYIFVTVISYVTI